MKVFNLPYIRAVEYPVIKLNPTAMKNIVLHRHVDIDFELTMDNYHEHVKALKALCDSHYIQSNGLIGQSRISSYVLHLNSEKEDQHKIVEIRSALQMQSTKIS